MTGVQSAKHKSAVTSGTATATPSAPAAPAPRHLLPCGSRIVVQGEHDIAVHLVERQQPSTPKARGVQEERTVLSHGHRVVFHMIAQIETVVRGLAHPALTAR